MGKLPRGSADLHHPPTVHQCCTPSPPVATWEIHLRIWQKRENPELGSFWRCFVDRCKHNSATQESLQMRPTAWAPTNGSWSSHGWQVYYIRPLLSWKGCWFIFTGIDNSSPCVFAFAAHQTSASITIQELEDAGFHTTKHPARGPTPQRCTGCIPCRTL